MTPVRPRSSRLPPPPPSKRFKLSYRVSLAVAIPALVVAVGAVTAVRGYLRTRASVHVLSESIFGQVAEQASGRTRSYLESAVPALDVLVSLSERDQRAGAHDSALGLRLHAMLRAHPGFTWVSYGDEHGEFSGAFRAEPGRVRFNHSVIGEDGRTTLEEHDLREDGSRPRHTHLFNTGYDPRRRPWYAAAQGASVHAWTAPYIFFNRHVPGISCVRALRAGAQVRGVYSVDFELDALSRFVSQLKPSPNSVVFVFTREGEVVAHPTLSVVSAGAEPRLVRLSDVRDAELAAFRSALGARDVDADGHRHFRFASGSRPFLGSVARLPIEGSLEWRVGVLAPESDFMGDLERENRATLAFGAASVVVAVLLGLWLASRVSRPVAELREEMERVGEFTLEERPEVRSVFAEIDAMGKALAQMKSGLASFARFVPRDVVRKMLASGREAELGGEVRTLTVVFSDLAGFTTLAESMEPDALVRTLGGYLEAMTDNLTEGGGTVDKYIGDGIMSFWNAPLEDNDHATRACLAALTCQRALVELAKDRDHAWVASTKTRFGIATGPVVVGNVGTPERMNYTAMGDAVNLSARLESLNKQYGTTLMVAESTVVLLGDAVLVRPIDVVAVQGKQIGVKVYELLASSASATDEQRGLARLCETALERYLQRDFRGAISSWRAALELVPMDPVAKLMLARAESYLADPPPDEWNGVYVAKGK
ncbi:MAG: adenylate/guanylate cyclase domain-containing protein [Myxococcales bacterium]|nr:adenylate/guanylate cyclase domain-containing protein [Myxococcales bacterium]